MLKALLKSRWMISTALPLSLYFLYTLPPISRFNSLTMVIRVAELSAAVYRVFKKSDPVKERINPTTVLRPLTEKCNRVDNINTKSLEDVSRN